jgi:hypothetical protein
MIDTPPGVITGAQVRPDRELWYAISSSADPSQVHCGAEVLRLPGEPAPGGVAYGDVDVGQVHAFAAEPAGSRPYRRPAWAPRAGGHCRSARPPSRQ